MAHFLFSLVIPFTVKEVSETLFIESIPMWPSSNSPTWPNCIAIVQKSLTLILNPQCSLQLGNASLSWQINANSHRQYSNLLLNSVLFCPAKFFLLMLPTQPEDLQIALTDGDFRRLPVAPCQSKQLTSIGIAVEYCIESVIIIHWVLSTNTCKTALIYSNTKKKWF